MIFKEESQLMQNIKLGHLYRVYLLYGEEKYLKEMYLKKLVKLAAPQGLEEFNLHRFDAGQMEVDDLIESCEALPMMAQQRCVVVEKFDFESLNAQDKAKVTELLEDPPETTVLLLVVDKEDFLPKKSASAKKLVALCDKAGVAPSKVFPHNLRHLFARTFYRVCRDVAKLADVLGHSSIETTRIYLISTGTEHAGTLARLGLVC